MHKFCAQIQVKQLRTLKARNVLLCQSRNTTIDLARSLGHFAVSQNRKNPGALPCSINTAQW